MSVGYVPYLYTSLFHTAAFSCLETTSPQLADLYTRKLTDLNILRSRHKGPRTIHPHFSEKRTASRTKHRNRLDRIIPKRASSPFQFILLTRQGYPARRQKLETIYESPSSRKTSLPISGSEHSADLPLPLNSKEIFQRLDHCRLHVIAVFVARIIPRKQHHLSGLLRNILLQIFVPSDFVVHTYC